MLGALRKKQLTASFVEHFKGNHENTTYDYFAEVILMVIWILHGNMIPYFHINSIAKMLSAMPDNSVTA